MARDPNFPPAVKVLDVIGSCRNREQLLASARYLKLWVKRNRRPIWAAPTPLVEAMMCAHAIQERLNYYTKFPKMESYEIRIRDFSAYASAPVSVAPKCNPIFQGGKIVH